MPAPIVTSPEVMETVLSLITTVTYLEKEIIVIRGREFYPQRKIEAGSSIVLMPKQGQKKIYWIEQKKFDDGVGNLAQAVKKTSGITYTDAELGV